MHERVMLVQDISTFTIPATSKTGKNGIDNKNYLVAYKTYTLGKRIFSPRSSTKVDSQFSERLAADGFGFDVDHSRNLDGLHPITNETYEVKGTGFSNNTAHFNPNNKADHVIWIKVTPTDVIIKEISTTIYNSLPSVLAGERASITLDAYLKSNPSDLISSVSFTY